MTTQEVWIRYNVAFLIIGSLFIIVVILMYQFVWKPELDEAKKSYLAKRKKRALASKT